MFANRPLLKRWVIRSSIALAGLLVAALLLLWSATGPLGRWAVMQLADGRDLPRGLILELEGLTGNVLACPRIERLALSDQDGVFLVLSNVEVDWSGLGVLGGAIDIERLSINHADLSRRPNLSPSTGSGGGLPQIRIGAASIDQADLGEPVLGQAASFRFSGDGNIAERQRVSLELQRIDAPGDRLSAEFRVSENGQVAGTAHGFIAGDGPVASLLPLEGRDLDFNATADGTLDAGSGRASVRLAGADFADADLGWQDSGWSARINAQGQLLDELNGLPVTPEARIYLDGPLQPAGINAIEAEGAGWQLNALPAGDQQASVTLTLANGLLNDLLGEAAYIQQVRWTGDVDWRAGFTADGILEGSEVSASGVTMNAFGGSLLIASDQGETNAYANLTGTGVEWPDSPLSGSFPWVGLELTARQTGSILLLEQASISADGLAVSAEGEVDTLLRAFAGSVTGRLEQMERFTTGASGVVSLDLDVSELSPETARIGLMFDGGGLAFTEERLRNIASGLTAATRLETDYESWSASGLSVRSNGLLAEGNISGTRFDWQAELDAALTADLGSANADVSGGIVLALEAQGDLETATGLAEITTDSVSLSGRTLDTPRLGLDFTASRERQSADWQFEGNTPWGEAAATGTFVRSPHELEIITNEAAVGVYPFQARTALNNSFWSGNLTATDWALDGRRVDALSVSFTQEDGGIDFSLRSNGLVRDPYEFEAQGRIADGQLRTELSGAWADIPIETRTPLTFRFSGAPVLQAGLNIGEGQADLDWQTDERLRVTISDLPAATAFAAARMPAATGLINAEAQLIYQDGNWTGATSAELTEFRLQRLRTGSAVDIRLQSTLAENVSTDIAITGDDLTGQGRLIRSGPVASLSELVADAPVSGQINLTGAIAPLLAVVLADTRQLSGEISTDLIVGGSVQQPVLTGETRFTQGQYQSNELGVSIRDVEASLSWEGEQIRLDSLTANSESGGTLQATGTAGLTEAGWRADIDVSFNRFHAIRRPDLSVVASGQSEISATRSAIDVAGTVNIDRIDARPPDANASNFAEIEVTEINQASGPPPRARQPIPVFLNVRINASDEVFVSGDAFSSEWRADLEVFGSTVKPQINGDVVLIDGRAFVLNRAFRLQEGRVTLNGGPRTAEIDLLARHNRESLTVDARLSGPVSSPSLLLTSDPALPEDEILARLLFDRNSGQLSALETATIAAQLSGQNLFGIVGGLRRAAGLDRLDFATTTDGQIVVTGGQRISDDVYLELESRGVALSSARLEWSLSPDLTLLSRLTGDTEASIALRWRAEFD